VTESPASATARGSLAVVVGASGGIGRQLVTQLAGDTRYATVLALSRSAVGFSQPKVRSMPIDITNEPSIEAAAECAKELGVTRLVICATGVLHTPDLQPERSWKAVDATKLLHLFHVNAIGPALVAKYFLAQFPRDGRSVFAALSARVGSVADNRRGGWYAYRASKAALNMLIKTYSIELARRAPEAICVGLHPGTVDTALSAPFQRGLDGTEPFAPQAAAHYLLQVIDGLRISDTGGVYAWDGARIPE